MHAVDIAAEVSRLGLYRQRKGGPVCRKQVVARMTKPQYRDTFERTLQHTTGFISRDQNRH